MAAPNHSPTSQTNGNQVLKSQTLAWLSPGMGEVASTCLPWPRGLHKSQLCASKAATLLLQSLGLCMATSPPPKSSHPKAARQTLEHPGSLQAPSCPWAPGHPWVLAGSSGTHSHQHGCMRMQKEWSWVCVLPASPKPTTYLL